MPNEPWDRHLPDDSPFNDFHLSEKSFQLLFTEYFPILCAYCQYKYSFDLELSKEAVHTGFIKLWENRESLIAGKPVKAYLYRIISNTCVDIIRHHNSRKRYEKKALKKYSEQDVDQTLDQVDLKELTQAIDSAVASLPEKMKEIFELSRYEGLKYTQIAERLNISVKTVETQMARALVKLRNKLGGFIILLPCIFFFTKLI